MRTIIGIDPGFRSLGWSVVELHRDREVLVDCGVIRTKKARKCHKVYDSEDNVRCAMEICSALRALPWDQACAVASEAQSWPRSNTVSAKVGHAWGILVAFAFEHSLSVLQASPQQIKRACTGSPTASKAEVIACLSQREGFEALPELLAPFPKGQHEHMADSCGAVVAVLDSDVVKMVRRFL